MQAQASYYIHVFADPCSVSGLHADDGVIDSYEDALAALITDDGVLADGYLHTLHVFSSGAACMLQPQIMDLSGAAQQRIDAAMRGVNHA
jgi:hypothetical protein